MPVGGGATAVALPVSMAMGPSPPAGWGMCWPVLPFDDEDDELAPARRRHAARRHAGPASTAGGAVVAVVVAAVVALRCGGRGIRPRCRGLVRCGRGRRTVRARPLATRIRRRRAGRTPCRGHGQGEPLGDGGYLTRAGSDPSAVPCCAPSPRRRRWRAWAAATVWGHPGVYRSPGTVRSPRWSRHGPIRPRTPFLGRRPPVWVFASGVGRSGRVGVRPAVRGVRRVKEPTDCPGHLPCWAVRPNRVDGP